MCTVKYGEDFVMIASLCLYVGYNIPFGEINIKKEITFY